MNVWNKPLLAALTTLALLGTVTSSISVWAKPRGTEVVKYDAASDIEYQQMWALELAAGGTRSVTKFGTTVNAVPFHVGADFSVFDHLKYIWPIE